MVQESTFLLAVVDLLFPNYGMCIVWRTGKRGLTIDWKGWPGAMDHREGISRSYMSGSGS